MVTEVHEDTLSRRESIKTFRRILPYILRRWKFLVLMIICLLISNNLIVMGPLIGRDVIDKAIMEERYELLVPLILFMLGVIIVSGIFSAAFRYLSRYFAEGVVFELRVDAFKALQRQSFAFFDRMPTGQLISRITNDADVLSRFITWPFTEAINTIVLFVISLNAMITMSTKLTLITLPVYPLMFILYYRYGLQIRPLFHSMRHQFGVMASVVNESIIGIRTVKALGIEDYEKEKFRVENDKYLKLALKALRLRALYNPASFLILGAGTAMILYLGGLEILKGNLTVGSLMAFISYMTMIRWPMRGLAMFVSAFQRAMTAAQRIFEIIETVPEVKEKPNAIELPEIRGHIIFEHVSFGYDKENLILRDINLEIRPGEKIAIVGPVGSGKSTLIKLIPRFYDVTEGRILIDGYDIRDVKIKSLRRQIAIVSQEPLIFAGTIRENIAFGVPNASMKKIIEAAKIAKLHEFIESLPNGYDTLIGERGITLSGGQKQRLAIARAILTNPKILILDDPTSNLDPETEMKLINDLKRLIKGRTTLIVTQRLRLLQLADRIIVLDKGRIVEEGTHEELMKRRGVYYKLYRIFFEAQEQELAKTMAKTLGRELI